MKKADVIIFVAIAVAAILILACSFGSDEGTTVTVTHNGEVIDTLSINENTEKTYYFDSGSNTLLIKDGKVSITEADCSGDCVASGEISRSGSSIVCLPHKLVIKIEGGLDAVTK